MLNVRCVLKNLSTSPVPWDTLQGLCVPPLHKDWQFINLVHLKEYVLESSSLYGPRLSNGISRGKQKWSGSHYSLQVPVVKCANHSQESMGAGLSFFPQLFLMNGSTAGQQWDPGLPPGVWLNTYRSSCHQGLCLLPFMSLPGNETCLLPRFLTNSDLPTSPRASGLLLGDF